MTRAASPNTRYIATAVTALSAEGRDYQVSASAEDYATNVTPASIPFLWPPDHTRVDHVLVNGVTDSNGDPITITITGIRQDEPVDSTGDGEFTPDAAGVGDSSVWLRAERQGGTESNGRVYHVAFSASDGRGGVCTGTVKSIVPHDMGNPPTYVDDEPTYDSTESVVGTRPGRPRNARGSSNGHNVTISWDVPEDVTNTAQDADFGRARSYTVVAGSATGGSDPSDEVVVTSVADIPGAPGVPVVETSSSGATLSWSAPTSGRAPAEYSVIAGTGPGAADVGRFSTSLARTLTQVLAAGTYNVRVVATNAGGDGPLSEETSFTVVPAVPGAPGTPQVTVDGSAVTVTWAAPTTGAAPTSYTLIAGNTSGGNQLGTVTAGLTRSFSFTLSPGTYYIRVVANNGAGNESASPEASFVIYGAPGAPGTPRVLINDDSVTLSWSAPTTGGPVTRYLLVVGTTKGGSEFGTVDVGAQTSITVSNAPRDNYYVRVIAVNSMGQSPASEQIPFRVR